MSDVGYVEAICMDLRILSLTILLLLKKLKLL